MAVDCILPSKLDEMFENIRNSGLTPRKMIAEMSKEQRLAFLEKYLGTERAKMVNDLWEEKYIVPQQKENLEQWAGYDNPVINRIRKLDRALDPADPDLYIDSYIRQKLGMAVSAEDAQTLHEYQIAIDNELAELNKSLGRDYLTMWRQADLNKMTQEQKDAALRLGLYINKFNKFYQEVFEKQAGQLPGALADRVGGTFRTFILSGDTSWTRQLSNLFWTHPKEAFTSWAKGHGIFWSEIWKGEAIDEAGNTKADYLWAGIYSHPNYLNGTFKELGVPLGIVEEQFISSKLSDTSLQEGDNWVGKGVGKIAGKQTGEFVGRQAGKVMRAYSAAEHAFEAAVSLGRFTAVNSMMETYGGDVQAMKEAEIGKQINEATGRWTPKENEVLSPKLMKKVSNWVLAFRWTASRIATAKNIIYAPAAVFSGATSKGRYFNARNRMRGRAAIGQVLVMGVMTGLQRIIRDWDWDDDKDFWDNFGKVWGRMWDFKGDFGKFVVWDTRIDMTFGVASFIKMVAQTVDAIRNPKFGKDIHDPVARWLSYRVSPQVSFALTAAKQGYAVINPDYLPKDAIGHTQTKLEAVRATLIPIWINNAISYAYDTERTGAQAVLEGATASLADFLGLSANTYMNESKSKVVREWGRRSPMAQLSPQTKLAKELEGKELKQARERMTEMFLAGTYDLYEKQGLGDKSEAEQDAALQKLRARILKQLNVEFGLTEKPKSGAQRRKEKKQNES